MLEFVWSNGVFNGWAAILLSKDVFFFLNGLSKDVGYEELASYDIMCLAAQFAPDHILKIWNIELPLCRLPGYLLFYPIFAYCDIYRWCESHNT